MKATRIIIIEDDPKIVRILELELKYEGYEVESAYNGKTGLEMLISGTYDLVLLDVMLPEISGFEVLRRIRQDNDLPVIILTARDDVTDKVKGLDLGADDYVTKPFAIEELLARVRSALRKREIISQNLTVYRVADLELDSANHTVTRAFITRDLTKKEYDLLKFLIENKGIILTRDQILQHVWGFDFFGNTNVVDVYIRYLRAKIDDEFDEKLIQTVRGVGYCVRELCS
ncbi:MAG: response regulator transcription factor [Eubacteriales bacterium]